MNSKAHTYQDIKEYLGEHTLIGDPASITFSTLERIDTKNKEALCFIDQKRRDLELLITNSASKLIIIGNKKIKQSFPSKILIQVSDPKLIFSIVGNALSPQKITTGIIHKTAVIHDQAQLEPNVTIGPNCTIGKAKIGKNSVIFPNVTIYDGVEIGENVIINSGTVIGAEGYGYNRDEEGILIQFPHLGKVIIQNGVEIGANVCIDRGALSDTVIGEKTKIDNLVHIAHNVIVGKNCCIVANAVICGSTKIGDNSYIAPSSCIRDAIQLGSDCIVGLSSTVMKSMPDDSTWLGSPALPLKEFVSQNKILKRLRNNKD